MSDGTTNINLEENPDLSVAVPASIPLSSPQNMKRDRTESERNGDDNSRPSRIFLTDPNAKHQNKTFISEENLIHSNEWVEENINSTAEEGHQRNPIWSKPICKKIKNCYESKVSTYLIFVAVVVAILVPELYTLSNLPDTFRYAYDAIILINGLGLIVDIVFASMFVDKYVLRLYFWADVLGTVSIAFDFRILFGTAMATITAVLPSLVILRSTRMARIGKLLRVQRAIRSIRLVRIMRLLKIEKFSDALTQASTLAILLIVCLQPVLSLSTWMDTQEETYMLLSLSRGNTPDTKDMVLSWFQAYTGKWHTLPVLVKNFNESWVNPSHPHYSATPGGSAYSVNQEANVEIWRQGSNTEVVLDRTWMFQIEAGMQLGVMVVVLAALAGLSAYIYRRVNKDILLPIGSVFHMIEQVIPGVFSEDTSPEDADDHISELALLVSKLSRIAYMANATEEIVRQDIVNSNADDATKAFIMKNYYDQPSEQPEGRESLRESDASGDTIDSEARRSSSVVRFRANVTRDPEMTPEILQHLKTLKSLNFCCYDYDTSDLMMFARLILQTEGFLLEFAVPDMVANQFIERVRHGYEDVPYHSFYHAVDVMQTLYYFFTTIKAELHTDRLHIFCGLLAALGHDIGHGGVNNSFLVRSRDKLAMVYNDISVLENMHAATLFTIMGDGQFNILCGMTPQVWCKARKVIVQSILSTDMSHHFKLINETELFFEINQKKLADFRTSQKAKDKNVESSPTASTKSELPDLPLLSPFMSPQCQLKLVPLLLHAADISNPAKPFEIYSRHAEKVMEEFFQQGEKEEQCGLEVSPMFDRSNSSLAKAQVGFIEFAVGPLYAALLKIFPKLRRCTQHLVQNRERYAQMDLEAIKKEEREQRVEQNKTRHRSFIQKFNSAESRSNALAVNLFASTKLAMVHKRLNRNRSSRRGSINILGRGRKSLKKPKRRSMSLDHTAMNGSLFAAARNSQRRRRSIAINNATVHPEPVKDL